MALTEAQRADLALLLARSVTRANLASLASAVLGDVPAAAGNDLNDVDKFARGIVAELEAAGLTQQFIAVLRDDLHRDARLTTGIQHILAGNRLDDDATLQQLVNQYEPFLSSLGIFELLPRMYRTVCAIALGDPHNDLVGSGFLIAPDLVMTNYHVVDSFLDETQDPIVEKPGTKVYCIFDYLAEPAPKLPLDERQKYGCLVVESAERWLEYARPKLPNDGTDDAPDEVGDRYDYAVIRLAKRIGSRPARRSSASVRGWLSLPDTIDVHPAEREEKRILVFQHPQKLPQQFDIGTYQGLDRSLTRIRYRVSTAHGSSGGAAVDTAGTLLALHNAEVRGGQAARVNQGIRIDRIAKDLAAVKPTLIEELKKVGDPTYDRTRFWSLSDDPADPQPIIGRTRFRENVVKMLAPDGPRVMVVTGPPASGVRFSIRLLRRTLGTQVPVVEFHPKDLERLSPETFLRTVVQELGVLGVSAHPLPAAPSTEQLARWLRFDLPSWLADRLAADETRQKARYPAWVVINTVVPPGERLLWADMLRDFVAALAGVRDAGQPGTDVVHLRWLFLGSAPEALPIPGTALHDEDLSRYDSWESDFSECLSMAWLTVEQQQPLPELLQKVLARNFKAKGEQEKLPLRQALASGVRELLLQARAAGGGQ